MGRRATKLRLTIYFVGLVFYSGIGAVAQTQTRPNYPIIFDDFDYHDEQELFGANPWTNLDGFIHLREQAWYKGNWDQLEFAGTAHFDFATKGSVRLQTDKGHFYKWESGYLPPVLVSGFSNRTGTWAARLRLDDISLGKVTDSPLTLSFWTHSTNVVCTKDPRRGECGLAESRWSEFNHEWNNSFDYLYPQFLSNGGVIDGEDTNTGAFRMRDPIKSFNRDLSCRLFRSDIGESIEDASACMKWFISNDRSDRYADLLISYDSETLVFEAAAWRVLDMSDFGIADVLEGIRMKEEIPIGRAAQSMATRFTLLGRTRDSCESMNLFAVSCWKQDRSIGFSIDWFFYSPSTQVELMDVVDNINWLRANNRNRVNTTGQILTAPPQAFQLSVELLNPLTNSVPEWTVVPIQRATKYYTLKVSWRYRSRVMKDGPWTAWSQPEVGGFTYSPPVKYEARYQVEVSALVSDWYDESNRIRISGCMTDFGNRVGECDVVSDLDVLAENYPEPFNNGTSIRFELPESSLVKLTIYDILGRYVTTLADDYRRNGTYTVHWDATSAASGIYLYVLETKDSRLVEQMVLLK